MTEERAPGRLLRLRRFLVDAYASADPRSLGLFRIALGVLLFVDVARRIGDLTPHYTNHGWLTNHFALYRPMSSHLFSVYHAFSTPGEVGALVAVHLLVNLALMVGWHTRIMHVLAAILITSINSRTIMLENGGWVVLNLLTVWSMFLPLDRRFSVDAWRRSWRARREGTVEALNDRALPAPERTQVVSLAVTALILQWAVIYYFNTLHKTALPWRDGTAVYYFFQQDRMVTAFGAFIRHVMPLEVIQALTWSTLVIEGSLVVLLLVPFKTHITRMLAWLLVCALHLSIDAVVQLGPFSWAMVILFVALIPPQAWARLHARRLRNKPRRWLVVDPGSGLALAIGRVVKRLDAAERVRFVAASDPELPEALGDVAASNQFVVIDEKTGQHAAGATALRWLLQALPLGWLGACARLPGLRGLVGRSLGSLFQRRERVDRFLQLDDLPGQDRVAPGPSAAGRFVRRVAAVSGTVCVALLMLAAASQVLIENRAVPRWMKPEERPEWMTAVVLYPRLFQGWSMFAPGPPTEDGRLVIDGLTADGRRLDPLTGQAPSFEVQPREGFRMNQIWGDFHRRIAEPRFSPYLQGVRDMLVGYHEISGRPDDQLVAFDVWYVTEQIPPYGEPKLAPSRKKLLSHGAMRPAAPALGF
jgi:hypothetical protein